MTCVVVTGVSKGIGRAMAVRFAANGCTVIGCARSTDAIMNLRQEPGQPHQFDVVDVATDSAVQSWADAVLKKHGPPDFLINNAAVINTNAPLWQVSAAEFDQVTAVNINGTANTIRHFAPAMVERSTGVIVNLSSGWGRSASADVAPYCASKWAIEGLTRALADDLPSGMAAVPLNPGVINTEMLQSCFGSAADSYPSPGEWAERAVPFILGITADDNGHPLTVPGR
ncbi:MAG: SDR family oxidoreductase [Planctomycetaceae bacterium]|jgi:NAD(P)-dependent dehydrogenase (short-subunit alcohol dehydrogenase family)